MSSEQERLDIISSALGRLIRQQDEFDRRLARIEQMLGAAVERPVPVPVAAPVVVAPQASAPPPRPAIPPPLPAHVETRPEQIETSIGLTLINRIGAITLVLGIGFFFKWAVDNNYIGPAGRVELGLLVGLLTVAGADFLWRRNQTFAQGITAVGISILYLALYAAFGFYHLVPQGFAFIAMVTATGLATALALRYNSVAIAALGLAGAYITPALLSTNENRPWFLFIYLLLIDLGALALARLRSWRLLEYLSFAGTWFLYAAWFVDHHDDSRLAAAVFAFAFYALYTLASSREILFLIAQASVALALPFLWERSPGIYFPLALLLGTCGLALAGTRRWPAAAAVSFASFWLWSGYFVSQFPTPPPAASLFAGLTCGFLLFFAWLPYWTLSLGQRARPRDLTILAVNALAYFGISYALLNPNHHPWMGLFAVAVAGMHLALGYVLWTRFPQEERTPVLLALGVALGFLTLAAPIQMTAWRITMAWSLEAAALAWIASRISQPRVSLAAAIVFALAILRLVTIDAWIYLSPKEYGPLANDRLLTFAVSALCLFLAANWTRQPALLRLSYYIGGHVVLLWTLTQEVLGSAARSSAPANLLSVETTSVSLLYAVYAVALISLGVGTRTAINRISGLILIGAVVLKLYLFDVWQIERVYRTLAFVALGILLLSTSFLYSRFRSLVESWWKDDEARVG